MENKSIQSKRFDSFLNKTIILSSKRYYRNEITKDFKELKIIDDENYSEYIKKYIQYDEVYNFDFIDNFKADFENIELVCALKSLSNIELTVIFLLYQEQLTSSEASKILKICSDSVTRIKRRALKKQKNIWRKNNNMDKETLYELGKKAKNGDEIALIKIIDNKRNMIKKYSFGDEDRYQYIIERLIIGIKNYKF